LLEIAGAIGLQSFLFRAGQCRQQEGGEDRDNGNDDEELNEGERKQNSAIKRSSLYARARVH